MASKPLYNRHAVYLNNVGCALLIRCAFNDAVNTFSDALHFAKHDRVLANGASGPPCILQERLHQANQNMAAPHVCSCSHCSGDTLVSRPTTPKNSPSATSSDFYQDDMDDIFLQSSISYRPVRIEEHDLVEHNINLYSGIMMFNLGLAYAGLSRCDTLDCVATKQQLRAGAIHMFQLADSMFHHILTHQSEIENFEEWDQLKLCACVDIAILHSLLQLLADQHGFAATAINVCEIDDACKQVYDRVISLRTFLIELEQEFFCDFYSSGDLLSIVAAAAAA